MTFWFKTRIQADCGEGEEGKESWKEERQEMCDRFDELWIVNPAGGKKWRVEIVGREGGGEDERKRCFG